MLIQLLDYFVYEVIEIDTNDIKDITVCFAESEYCIIENVDGLYYKVLTKFVQDFGLQINNNNDYADFIVDRSGNTIVPF